VHCFPSQVLSLRLLSSARLLFYSILVFLDANPSLLFSSHPSLFHTLRTLGLQTYFTSGPTETRAWTINKGDSAPKAAGVIHSDFEKGFIRAEVQSYEQLDKLGSEKAVREAGQLRSEGKEYIMQEGDVVLFRFNV
jgi:ribosome-binding ATPase YchF (GTP1/OBG family)